VILRAVAHGFGQPPSQFLLQEFHDAAHLLQRETFAAQRADHRDLGNIIRRVQPAPAFALGNDDAALVPPLQLSRRDAGKPYDLRRRKLLLV
jgi:hypothetical protein